MDLYGRNTRWLHSDKGQYMVLIHGLNTLPNTSKLLDLLPEVKPKNINPPTTARVKISQNVNILPKVYQVHLKVKHCQTLRVVSTFTGQNESTVWLVKALSGIVQDGQNDSKNQSKMSLCAHLGQQSKQAVDWFWPPQQLSAKVSQ